MEDTYLGKATERLFLPLMRITLPELVDMDLPKEGGFHNCVLVSMNKRYPLHARKVMHALWGAGQMQFCKCIVVVDGDVDVHDYAQVAWRVFNNVDWRRDVLVVEGPLDVLDHSSPQPLWGGKIGIDATAKGPGEGHDREWPPDVEMSAEVKARVDELWSSLGLGGRAPAGRNLARARRAGVLITYARRFASLVKFEHSIFALPFAYAAAFLAEMAVPGFWRMFWITVAMVAARSFGMAINRLIDAGIDARNPRTAGREIPAGLLTRWQVWLFALASLAVLIVATFNLPVITRYLWPLVVIPMVVYPYTKRWTWLCHLVLGLADGLGPVGAWVAVTGEGHVGAVPAGRGSGSVDRRFRRHLRLHGHRRSTARRVCTPSRPTWANAPGCGARGSSTCWRWRCWR